MNATNGNSVVQGNANALQPAQATNLRSRVVEILAATANGCLTELGYYPGMSQKMQELEKQNANWQQENVKLFQDNQSLTRALHEHGKTQQAQTIRVMQQQLQTLLQEKAMLTSQVQNLMAGQPTAYHQVLRDYQRLQEMHQKALHEISTLRHANAALSSRTPAQSPVTPVFHTTAFAGVQQPGPSRPPPPKPTGPTNCYPSTPNTPGSSSNGIVNAPPAPVIVPSHMNGQQSQQFVDQVQIKQQNGALPQSIAIVSEWNRKTRPSDGNLPRSISRISSVMQSGSRPVSATSTSRPVPTSLDTNTSPVAAVTNGSLPTPITASYLPQRQSYLPEVSSSAQLARVSSLPQPLPSPVHHMGQSSFVLAPPNHPPAHSQPILSVNRPGDAPVTQQTAVDGRSTSVEAVKVKATIPHEVRQPQSASPAEPFEAITPMTVVEDNPAVVVASSLHIEQESLKRPSLSALNPEDLPAPKKPRIEETQELVSESIPPTTNNPQPNVHDDVAENIPPTTDGELPIAEEVKKDDDDDEEESGDDEEEESDDEEDEVRVGPDGLRLVEDCLLAFIESDDQGQKTCTLCRVRFERGFIADKPKPFTSETTEDLVLHFTSEHQSAWEKIRKAV